MNKKIINKLLLLFILIIIAVFLISHFVINTKVNYQNEQFNPPKIQSIQLNKEILKVEIADTPLLRQKGLSDRQKLADGTAMLFIFPQADLRTFWMKDMLFPLDLIWFDEKQKIIDLTFNAEPEGNNPQKLYQPQAKAQYVLEVPAGWINLHQVTLGQSFSFCINQDCAQIKNSSPALPKENQDPAPLPTTEEQADPEILPTQVKNEVPFAVQAPFANWQDPRQEDGCEEASIVMAIHWMNGQPLTKQQSLTEILALSHYQEEAYGYFQNTNAQDTAQLMQDYYKLSNIQTSTEVSLEKIKSILAHGDLVITPMNGRLLKNPFYTPPGPERHMILIVGYDDQTQEFITNDPGTKRGEGYRYNYDLFLQAIRDYPSGTNEPIAEENKKAMIIIQK